MFLESWKRSSITAVLSVALLAFSLCLGHPANADDHGTSGETEHACEIAEPLSVVLPSPPVTAPIHGPADDAGSDLDSLPAIPSVDISRDRSLDLPFHSDPPIHLTQRYKFFCTYRI